MKCNVDLTGRITNFGIFGDFDLGEIDLSRIEDYIYCFETNTWLYLPKSTPVDKSIRNVEYNWQAMTASIYINDLYRPGPYVFDCTSMWTEQDCINAINSLDL